MSLKGLFKELRRRHVLKVAVAYTGIGIVLLEVLSHLFHNFEAPHWVLKVITTLLIVGLPVACLMAWGFEFKEGAVRSIPRVPKESKPALPAPETTAPPSIAVLPFEDMSSEQDQKYLGNGIAEELLNALAGIEELKVAARTSSFSLASRGASMKEIGDTLHVRHVLEGSVRRSGRKLRVTAQLIDVGSGFHLFSEAYDRAVEDIFDIQNEIAREIVDALLPKLGLSKGVMLVRQGTTNLEAHNLRLKAHEQFTSLNPESLRMAIDGLRQALRLDPQYWDAWGDLAYAYAYTSIWASDPSPYLMQASSAAAFALANSPTHVMALLMQGFVKMLVYRDEPAASHDYKLAQAAGVDPSNWAFQNAYAHDGPLGRYPEAIAALKDAEQKDPLAPNVKWALIEMYLAAGQTAEAAAKADELGKLGPKAPAAQNTSGLALLAIGDIAGARQCLAAVQAITGSEFVDAAGLQFAIDAATGDRADAQELLARLLRPNSAGEIGPYYLIGEGYKALGDYAQAIDWWARAVDRHEPYTLVLMPPRNRNHPVIGKDPRFLALLKRMGLTGSAKATVPG